MCLCVAQTSLVYATSISTSERCKVLLCQIIPKMRRLALNSSCYLYIGLTTCTCNPSVRLLVRIISLIIREQSPLPSTRQIFLQPTVTFWINVTYTSSSANTSSFNDSHNSSSKRHGVRRNSPSPPNKLSTTGKKTKACVAANTTSASQTLK